MSRSVLPLGVALLGALLAVPLAGRAACYTVYQAGQIASRSIAPPVDLSKQLHETVPVAFGSGASMVIAEAADGCTPIDNRQRRLAAGLGGRMQTGVRRRGVASVDTDRRAGAEAYFERQARPIRSEVGASPASTTGDATPAAPMSGMPPSR